MADEDFNIKVVTTADTSGIEQTTEEFEKLKALSISAGISPEIADQLARSGAYFDATKNNFVSIHDTAEETTKEVEKTSDGLGDAADAAQVLGTGFQFSNRAMMGLAHSITSGNLNLRSLVHLMHGLGPAGIAAGIGAFVAFESIKKMREEAQKTSDEMSKLGQEFLKSAMAAQGLVSGSRTGEDVAKVAQSVLPELEKIHAEADKLNKKTITSFQKGIEDMREGIIQMSPHVSEDMRQWAHPYTIELREAQDQARSNADFADHEAKKRIERAQDFKRQFEDLKKVPFEDAMTRLTNRLKEAENLQKNLNKDGEDYARSWLAAESVIENTKKDIADIVKYHEQLGTKTAKYIETADPQVKAILMNEKAMFDARKAGRDKEAEMYEKTALQLHKSATPKQEQDLAKIYGAPEIVEALRQLAADKRSLIELWR